MEGPEVRAFAITVRPGYSSLLVVAIDHVPSPRRTAYNAERGRHKNTAIYAGPLGDICLVSMGLYTNPQPIFVCCYADSGGGRGGDL